MRQMEEKARIRAFLFHARRFHFIRDIFSSRSCALFFGFALASEKNARAPTFD
jgi:hypothetical protein